MMALNAKKYGFLESIQYISQNGKECWAEDMKSKRMKKNAHTTSGYGRTTELMEEKKNVYVCVCVCITFHCDSPK